MRYPSKKDSWIVFVIVAPGVALAGIAFYHLFVLGAENHITWLIMGIAALYGAIIWTLAYPVYYEITASHLLIRSGWLKFQIPLSTIETVRPTRNPLSAPAWSLDRLRIDYRRNDRIRIALISPENKARFLNELLERAANLERQGHQVVQKPTSPHP
ncbi:MAG: PH domain-containing protein [Gammaproteobacteria bacterium]|nr:PH domain-containing protein [Gammaproteobacteria bacterium]